MQMPLYAQALRQLLHPARPAASYTTRGFILAALLVPPTSIQIWRVLLGTKLRVPSFLAVFCLNKKRSATVSGYTRMALNRPKQLPSLLFENTTLSLEGTCPYITQSLPLEAFAILKACQFAASNISALQNRLHSDPTILAIKKIHRYSLVP